jgi:hypothetical protein
MAKISKFLLTFLTNLGNEEGVTYSLVPRNRSCGEPGDILLFNYKAKNKMYSEDRALLLTRPVVKNTQSGGLLLTGLTINLGLLLTGLTINLNPGEMATRADVNRLKSVSYLYKKRKELKDQAEPDEEIRAKTGIKNLELFKRYEKKYLKDKYRTFLSNNINGPLYRAKI